MAKKYVFFSVLKLGRASEGEQPVAIVMAVKLAIVMTDDDSMSPRVTAGMLTSVRFRSSRPHNLLPSLRKNSFTNQNQKL